jgi:hypothetical protein
MQIIDDMNTALENLMKKEYGPEMPFDISFAVPCKDFHTVSTERPSLNFYLYDIRENTELRSNEPLIENLANGSVIKKRPPTRIQLFYCITAWSPAQEDALGTKTREEHKQLSKALAALLKYPSIPSDVLSGDLIGQIPPLPVTTLLLDGMENLGQFWNALDGLLKPFLDYRITISLDIHEGFKGRMVTSKISEYGNETPVYVLNIRPELCQDQPKDTPLVRAVIEKIPIVSINSPSKEGDRKISLDSTKELRKNDFLILMDGEKTEFCQLEKIPGKRGHIPITQPLLFDHDEGTEIKRLSLSSEKLYLKLASTSPKKSSELLAKGYGAPRLKVGEVFMLGTSGKAEYIQITQVSGPVAGLADSETIVQFGGIVTNNAKIPAPIMGAKINLLDANGVFVAEATSNSEGKYHFRKLGIGRGKYTLKVEAQGYNIMEKEVKKLTSAKIEDFFLQLESR